MDTIDLQTELTKLVSYKSVTSDSKACALLLDYVEKLYRTCGLETDTGVKNGHPYLFAHNSRDVKNLDILLQAHIDVVPATDEMFSAKLDGDNLVGRGVYDMLFAVACFNKLLVEHGAVDASIGVLLTSDEEIGGVDGVGELIKNYGAKVCILPDAGTHEFLCIEAKGVLQVKLGIPGKAGHGARPWLTDSPILKIGEAVKKLDELFPNVDNDSTTCSFTQIHGGFAHNQVPSVVEMVIDIRFQPSDTPNALLNKIEHQLRPMGISVSVADVIGDSYATDYDSEYIQNFIQSYSKITGITLGTMRAPGSSDARFIATLGIPVIMCRPEGGGLHADDESISISSLENYYKVLKHYITTFKKV